MKASIALSVVTVISFLLTSSLLAGTWSIVAVDPATGDVGVAAATCLDLHIDAIAALVPGKGAAAVQARLSVPNRNVVYRLLQEGNSAEDIIQRVSDRAFDADVELRQYGIVTLNNGSVRVAAFTGKNTMHWAGSQQDISMGVTVQGNILVGEAVVADAMDAFKKSDAKGHNALPDRLMRALEAGSSAGGDRRCNNNQVMQTAATAFILVARGGDQPYAARALGITDMGTLNAPWLAISVVKPKFGPNPIPELRERYDVWRRTVELTPSIEPQVKLTTTWGIVKCAH
jgi:uncharacterized Ntn-hydrolase superfamily protein